MRNIIRSGYSKNLKCDDEDTVIKAARYGTHNSAESIDKIKKEYHIKDEAGEQYMVKEEGERHVKKEDKDRTIKAEPGHHDKISSGLFPSDVKIESFSSKSSMTSYEAGKSDNTTKLEVVTGDETTRVQEGKTEAESNASLNCETPLDDAPVEVKPCDTDTPLVAVERGQRRGRSAHSSAVTHDDDDNVVFLKRRGAILR